MSSVKQQPAYVNKSIPIKRVIQLWVGGGGGRRVGIKTPLSPLPADVRFRLCQVSLTVQPPPQTRGQSRPEYRDVTDSWCYYISMSSGVAASESDTSTSTVVKRSVNCMLLVNDNFVFRDSTPF